MMSSMEEPTGPFDIVTGYTQIDSDKFATRIIGQPVYDGTAADANKLGDISDIVIDESGTAQAVIIGVGGFLGIGEKQVAVAYSALTKQMAADYSEHGIRVNAICPGTVRTPLVEATYVGYTGSEEAAKQALARRDRDYPMGRLGAVEDIANLALFLASDESRWIAGGVYVADGGMTAVSQWSPSLQ